MPSPSCGSDFDTLPGALSAQAVLDEVLARLPLEPLNVTGSLVVRRRRGVVERELAFDMFLHWGAEPPAARYVIRDAVGQQLETLSVTHEAAGPRFEYQAGGRSQDATPDMLSSRIQRTDISWTDLTLSFLWWPGGVILGTEPVRGRTCYIVEVPSPGGVTAAYAKVRMWIDTSLFMLLEAEAYNEKGDPVRRLWVRSFKKINERWMIREMEIQAEPAVHRTKLRIEQVDSDAPSS